MSRAKHAGLALQGLTGVELLRPTNAAEEGLMTRACTRSLGLCALLLAPPVGAQILKCVDAEKTVTYSDVHLSSHGKARSSSNTRASSNVMDHSFIRAQKGRLFAPVAAAPAYSAPPAPPPPAPAPFIQQLLRQTTPAVVY